VQLCELTEPYKHMVCIFFLCYAVSSQSRTEQIHTAFHRGLYYEMAIEVVNTIIYYKGYNAMRGWRK